MRFRVALVLIVLAPLASTIASAQMQVWYWCDPARAYYPYVRQCSIPWRPVNPATVLPQPYAAPRPPANAQLKPVQPPASSSNLVSGLAPVSPSSPVATTAEPQAASPAAPATEISDDYRGALRVWLEGHKNYPEAARQRGEKGRVGLRFSVERSGRVLDYAVISSSGYPDLDAAGEAMIRGAALPPFPADMTTPEIEVSVTVDFGLQADALTPSSAAQQSPADKQRANIDREQRQQRSVCGDLYGTAACETEWFERLEICKWYSAAALDAVAAKRRGERLLWEVSNMMGAYHLPEAVARPIAEAIYSNIHAYGTTDFEIELGAEDECMSGQRIR